jgi:hypothetical protein
LSGALLSGAPPSGAPPEALPGAVQGVVAVVDPSPVCVVVAVAVVKEGTEGRQVKVDCVDDGAASWVCASGWATK